VSAGIEALYELSQHFAVSLSCKGGRGGVDLGPTPALFLSIVPTIPTPHHHFFK
jgi:hypothetical protein